MVYCLFVNIAKWMNFGCNIVIIFLSQERNKTLDNSLNEQTSIIERQNKLISELQNQVKVLEMLSVYRKNDVSDDEDDSGVSTIEKVSICIFLETYVYYSYLNVLLIMIIIILMRFFQKVNGDDKLLPEKKLNLIEMEIQTESNDSETEIRLV